MTEATWDNSTATPPINWHMSVALENVPRGDAELAEVTSLEGAVRTWLALDPEHREAAVLTLEHPVILEGVSHTSFAGEGIAELASRLSGANAEAQAPEPDGSAA